MSNEKENNVTHWIEDSNGEKSRSLTDKEKKKLNRLNVNEKTKKFIAGKWSQREPDEQERGQNKKIEKKLRWIKIFIPFLSLLFAFVLFLSFFDEGNMLNLGFDYYSNLVIPLERILTFILFLLYLFVFLIVLAIGIVFGITNKKIEESIQKDISKEWWGFFEKRPFLKTAYHSFLSFIVFILTIITGHLGIAFLMLGSFIISFLIMKMVKRFYKKHYT